MNWQSIQRWPTFVNSFVWSKDIFLDQAGLSEPGADYAHQITTCPVPRMFQTFPWPFQVTKKWHQNSIFFPNCVNHQICWSALPLIFMVIIFFDKKCNSGYLGKFFNIGFYPGEFVLIIKKYQKIWSVFLLYNLWISYFVPNME